MRFLFLSLLLFKLSFAVANQPVGIELVELQTNDKTTALSIWYPSTDKSKPITNIGDNAVFVGMPARINATKPDKPLPLIVVAHGGLRSINNSAAWLSAALAQAGYLVVEVNEPNPNATEAVNAIWQRPKTINDILAKLLADNDWGQRIDKANIHVIGFALGGTTALLLAGGNVTVEKFINSCDDIGNHPDCAWYKANNISLNSANVDELSKSRYNSLIRSSIAIAPEYLAAFANDKKLKAPTLLISLDDKAAKPTFTDNTLISNATIFDAFPICKPAGKEILTEEDGNPELCGDSAKRTDIHAKITKEVLNFITNNSN